MKTITLIPAYKPTYIADLLLALRQQTVAAGKIVFSDDSPGGEFRQALASERFAPLRAGLDIEVHEGPRNGAYENFKQLVRLGQDRADLLHLLLDDDVIYPDFYERHRLAHASDEFSCSVSRRWSASEGGVPMTTQAIPASIRQHPSRMIALDSQVILMSMAQECNNYFGEFSNAVFRADCAGLLLDPRLGDVSYAGLWDVGAFVAASLRKPLCLIQDHLGYFRMSPSQNSSNMNSPIMKAAHLGWIALAVGAHRIGAIDADFTNRYYRAIAPALSHRYSDQPDMAAFLAAVPALIAGAPGAEERFLDAWNPFLAKNGF